MQSLHQARPPRSLHGRRAQKGKVSTRRARWSSHARCRRSLSIHERQPPNTDPEPRNPNSLRIPTEQHVQPNATSSVLSTQLDTRATACCARWPRLQQSAVANLTPVQPTAPRASAKCTEHYAPRPTEPVAAIRTFVRPK